MNLLSLSASIRKNKRQALLRNFIPKSHTEVLDMSDEDLSLVLRTINAVRYRSGLKMLAEIPKGIHPDNLEEIGRSCPIAKALPKTVIALEYARTPDWRTAVAMSRAFGKSIQDYVEFPGEFVVDLPPVLMDFIAHYEYNLLPQFVEQS